MPAPGAGPQMTKAFQPHSRVATSDGLTEAERGRILAKSAIFAPPPMLDEQGRRE